MGKTLFITDLDGTLLNKDSKVSDESSHLLNEAIADGALFSVATARTPSTVSMLLKNVNTNLPFIVMTGSAVWDRTTQNYSNPITIPADVAAAVMQTIRKHRLPVFIYTLHGKVIDIYHYGPLSENEIRFMSEREDSPYKCFHIPADGFSELPSPLTDVILFYTMQPTDIVEAAYNDVKEIPGCTPIFYHDMFGPDTGIMEVFSNKSSKANALLWLKNRTNADKVVAFGDNINDIPMLKAADVAVAVENAVPEVKAVADRIIGPNTDNSVARFIRDYVRNES